MSECGRQDSNLHGLPGSWSRVPGSSSSGSQGRRVCQFHHARVKRGFYDVAGGVGLDQRVHTTPPFPTYYVVLLVHQFPDRLVSIRITGSGLPKTSLTGNFRPDVDSPFFETKCLQQLSNRLQTVPNTFGCGPQNPGNSIRFNATVAAATESREKGVGKFHHIFINPGTYKNLVPSHTRKRPVVEFLNEVSSKVRIIGLDRDAAYYEFENAHIRKLYLFDLLSARGRWVKRGSLHGH